VLQHFIRRDGLGSGTKLAPAVLFVWLLIVSCVAAVSTAANLQLLPLYVKDSSSDKDRVEQSDKA
jgi:hypothetical protein